MADHHAGLCFRRHDRNRRSHHHRPETRSGGQLRRGSCVFRNDRAGTGGRHPASSGSDPLHETAADRSRSNARTSAGSLCLHGDLHRRRPLPHADFRAARRSQERRAPHACDASCVNRAHIQYHSGLSAGLGFPVRTRRSLSRNDHRTGGAARPDSPVFPEGKIAGTFPYRKHFSKVRSASPDFHQRHSDFRRTDVDRAHDPVPQLAGAEIRGTARTGGLYGHLHCGIHRLHAVNRPCNRGPACRKFFLRGA